MLCMLFVYVCIFLCNLHPYTIGNPEGIREVYGASHILIVCFVMGGEGELEAVTKGTIT